MKISLLKSFLKDINGATAIEYGMLAALISIVIISVFTLLGDDIKTLFSEGVGDKLKFEKPTFNIVK
ncbi:MAG: Flp family type IVb pilin [Rhizobiales bacterium]|nr:Flp family type IVb pilin [Hyphomicrobiales bacterium]